MPRLRIHAGDVVLAMNRQTVMFLKKRVMSLHQAIPVMMMSMMNVMFEVAGIRPQLGRLVSLHIVSYWDMGMQI